ncbi:MAG: class I SAM-dependent methyltransferase [Elusimicrobia bacterium]|nr:class I SAM-dependent methyltransferase [Elusimicrobiota bacterium]
MKQDLIEEVPCNLCGKDQSKIRYQSLEGWPGDGGQYAATTDRFGAYGTIRQCLSCGLVYTSPRVKAGAIHQAYEETQDQDYFLEADSRSINAYLALSMVRRFAPSGRLLEVGCATGFFLNAARLTYEVHGVEPSRWARDYARENLKLEISERDLKTARFPDGHFDVVAAIDVIEHVPDPAGLLAEIRRVLKPGGVLYLVTPDIDSLSARLLRGKWWGLRPAHIYYFSPKTLQELLRRQGYETALCRSYGRIFTWNYWLSRLTNYPKFLSRALAAVIRTFGVEDKFLYLDTRDSMQIIARRPRG